VKLRRDDAADLPEIARASERERYPGEPLGSLGA
jgi:hypothetical protein